ncbi:MAG: ribonuclease HII [Spirochaetes bacterium]|nr:ribonuclease HII [Spirochaetota bacterium]
MKNVIVGVDEAGRGPLAGNVYAAAVILKKDSVIHGLNDSKKLSEKKRNELFDKIINNSIAYSIGFATNDEIDRINILQATFLAMKRALEGIKINFNYVLIDGNIFPFKDIYIGEAVVRGDTSIKEIMAASILAKVSRDNYMQELDRIYPVYNFGVHKGYPTSLHKKLIKQYGPCPVHRKTFKGVKEYILKKTN